MVGIGYTLGFASLTVGQLNLLTIPFIPALESSSHLVAFWVDDGRPGMR